MAMGAGMAGGLGYSVGDDVPLTTREGVRNFRLVGTFATLGQPPGFIVGQDDGRASSGLTV